MADWREKVLQQYVLVTADGTTTTTVAATATTTTSFIHYSV
jgi:hypothetical protein